MAAAVAEVRDGVLLGADDVEEEMDLVDAVLNHERLLLGERSGSGEG